MEAWREHAQTDMVNHLSIHWLTPLCTHCVSICHCRENYVSLPVLSQITPVLHIDFDQSFLLCLCHITLYKGTKVLLVV